MILSIERSSPIIISLELLAGFAFAAARFASFELSAPDRLMSNV